MDLDVQCEHEIVTYTQMDMTVWEIQSGNVSSSEPGEVAKDTFSQADEQHHVQQNVQFLDEVAGQSAGLATNRAVRTNDITPSVELADFLRRPVRIAHVNWLEANGFGVPLLETNPWFDFFNDARLKYKLHNYSFIRCTLKLKIVVNASPFYYGAALAAYAPLNTKFYSVFPPDGTTADYVVPMSQMPHIWLYPQNSEGGELSLPFLWNKNWLDLTVAQDFTNMGTLAIRVVAPLALASGTSGNGITVQVYAWAEDVELSGTTVALSMQGGRRDEYDAGGTISGPASAIAKASGMLRKVPGIGRFATAAEIGASAVSKISSLFGFTNTPVIEPPSAVRDSPFPQMASAEISYPSEKLSLDPKNELTVDPACLGLPSIDECDISYLVQKESYITTVDWTTANTLDTILFSTSVNPSKMLAVRSLANATVVFHSPLSWLSVLFNHWKGDIILRFKVVASQYHKGRLRLTWDPNGTAAQNIYLDAASTTVTQTAIVDIGKDSDFEFRIPYNQALGWLRTSNGYSAGWSTLTSPPWNVTKGIDNGAMTIRVLTRLTAPSDTSTVRLLVFARAAPDFEFANPGSIPDNYSPFQVQGGEMEISTRRPDGDEPTPLTAGVVKPMDPEKNLVNFGECVTNLKSLMRRYNFLLVRTLPVAAATDDYVVARQTFSKIPPVFGYDPAGIHLFRGLINPGNTYNFNCVKNIPLTWIMQGFVGVRGSTTWSINVDGAENLSHVRVFRNTGTNQFQTTSISGTTKQNISLDARYYFTSIDAGGGGSALTNQRTQSGLTVHCPQYNNHKFTSANPLVATNAAVGGGGEDYEGYTLEIAYDGKNTFQGKNIKTWWYVAAGPDFHPVFFLRAPVLYRYNALPNGN
jgi:hypothetical protein